MSTGTQLRVFLDTHESKIEEVRKELFANYLGGVGYGICILFEELPIGVDPLSPENMLVIATGPLTLHKIPGGGSTSLCFKSPLTNLWGESRCGGDFGPTLKKSGFDHIIIEGRSPEPVYLYIHDGTLRFRSASALVGKTVSEKKILIGDELQEERFNLFCIGPGGEKQVRYATVMSGDRAAGRCGAGAVMGSKNLIAIVVSGNGNNDVKESNPQRLKGLLRETFREIKENPMSSGFRNFGTIGDLPANDNAGDLPTKNWQSNSWGKGTELFDYFQEHNFIKSYGCYRGCPLSCGRKAKVENGPYMTPVHGGAEYESISCFTAYVLNEDVDAAVHCSYLCNDLGLDTISTGSAIAFAMECYEKGLLSEHQIAGMDLSWGNSSVLPKMVKMIAHREGIGNLLANGVRAAAEELGGGSATFAIHVKGLEGAAHDPRSGKALAVSYGTGNRGMCHIQPVEAMAWDSGKMDWGLCRYGLDAPETVDRWDEKGKGRNVKILQDGLMLPDILGTCKFFMYAGVTVERWAEILSALTGWKGNGEDLLHISERVINLQRIFNLREGMTIEDDTLPERVMAVPSFGKYQHEKACSIHDYASMLNEYYQARGWNPVTGAPTDDKLRELELNDLVCRHSPNDS